MSDYSQSFKNYYSPEPDKPIEEVALEVARKVEALESAVIYAITSISLVMPDVKTDVIHNLRQDVARNQGHPAVGAFEHLASLIENMKAKPKNE